MTTILPHDKIIDIYRGLESGRHSKEAALSNVDETFNKICQTVCDFSKLKSHDIQLLDGVLTALVERIQQLEEEAAGPSRD